MTPLSSDVLAPDAGVRITEPVNARVAGRSLAWELPALLLLLLGSAALFVWNLSASGWANPYYSAAALAGSKDWAAMLFGSFDAGNAITVDKTPAALWVMSLSARIFGFSSWSILAPQALEGVAAVWLLYLSVRRRAGALGGLVAGAVLALTPVAALMFRFNNPDALLTLLLVASAYGTLRALETASTRWLVLAGVAVGFAFLTKMLQGFVVIPVLAGVYLLAAPTTWWRRVRQVGAAALAVAVSAGWWVALVMLLPATSRPFIGGSQTNSIIDLMLGYNGLGRLTGDEVGRVGGGAPTFGGFGTGAFSDGAGWLRLFDGELGSNVSWLLPAALISFAALLWLTRRRRRTDPMRAQALLWGGWLLLTGLIFSMMEGIFHPYYTVVLVPAIGALVGMGAAAAWARRRHPMARASFAVAVALTVIWAATLLARSPAWNPWLAPVLLFGGGLAAVGLLFSGRAGSRIQRFVLAASVAVMMAAPALGAIATAAEAHSGAIPTTEPQVKDVGGGRVGPGVPGNAFRGPRGQAFQRPGNSRPFRAFGGVPNSGVPNSGLPNGGLAPGGQPGTTAPTFGRGSNGPANRGSSLGGLLDSTTPNAALVAALQRDASTFRWVAATTGANNAAGLALGSGQSVMAIGGFNGTDPSPTLAEFQADVAAGEIHYYVAGTDAGGFRGARGGSDVSAQISQWVADGFDATTIGEVTVYDLVG